MASKAQTNPSAGTIAKPIVLKLETIAHQIAGALQETEHLSVTIGQLVRDASKLIEDDEQIIMFVDACNQLCVASSLKAESVKVYMSQIRGVLRAMLQGYRPKAGASLKAMYSAAPKGTGRENGTKKTGARGVGSASRGGAVEPGDDDEDDDSERVAPAAPSRAEVLRNGIVAIFGHHDEQLAAAIEWARHNESAFLRMVEQAVTAQNRAVVAPREDQAVAA